MQLAIKLSILSKKETQRLPSHDVTSFFVSKKIFLDEEKKYLTVMQSGLLRILDLAKTAPQECKLDEISLLLAIKGINIWKTTSCLLSIIRAFLFLIDSK